MKRHIALYAVFALASMSCDARKDRALERLYAIAIEGGSFADASIITDRFVLVQELGVVLPRPQGPQWRTEKSIDRSSGNPIATVKFTRTDGAGSFMAIISDGDEDDVRAQVNVLGGMLQRTCGVEPRVDQYPSFDSYEIWLSCPLIPRNDDGTMGTPRVMKAAVTVRKKILGKVLAVIGIWPPEHDPALSGAMIEVIRNSDRLTDI